MQYVKLLLIIGLVGSVFYGLFVAMGVIKLDPIEPDPVVLDPTIDVVEEDNDSTDIILAQTMSKFLDRLRAADVSFEEVRKMSAWVQEHSAQEAKIQNFDEFRSKVAAYMEIIEMIEYPQRGRTWENIRRFVNSTTGSLIAPVHLKLLKATYIKELNSKGQPVLISNEGPQKVNAGLMQSGVYHSFKDIPSAQQILRGYSDKYPITIR